jgi:peptide/nickel transport system permease protein
MKKEKTLTPGRMVLNRFKRNKMAKLGFVIILIMFAFAFIGPIFSPYNEGQIFLSEDGSEMLLYQAPSLKHWLGTDGRGMDLLTRLMYGGRVSLLIGFIVVAIETSIGVVMGGIAGYYGKWVDSLIMRLVDIFNCIPFMPVMLLIGVVMSGVQMSELARIMILMIVMGLLGWSYIARIVRGQILSLREQEFMLATEALGIPAWRRIIKHLVPNVVPQIIVLATMNLGSVILTESSLSFLGIGVRYPSASWGNMIEAITNEHIMSSYPFTWIPPGLCILLTVLAFNFLGDGLRDAFDPKMKR